MPSINSIFDLVKEEFGLLSALLLIAAVILFLKLQSSWEARLVDKDREIARIAEDKKRLEEVILTRRMSSGLNQRAEPDDPGREEGSES